MSASKADEKADLLARIEHRTTLDRPNFEHFTLPDLRRIVDLFDEPRVDGETVLLTADELDALITAVSRRAARSALEYADEYRDAMDDFEAGDLPEPNDDPRTNAESDTDETGLSAVDRINGGYPMSPELVAAGVDQLRSEGREADARRLIQRHPSLYAVSDQSSGDHSDLDPAQIRANATGEDPPANYRNWDDDADLSDLAPSHDWLDQTEWDVKRESDDDLDGE